MEDAMKDIRNGDVKGDLQDVLKDGVKGDLQDDLKDASEDASKNASKNALQEDILFSDATVFKAKLVHLAVSGSVSCYKACDLLRLFLHSGLHVSAALSEGARHFITPLLVASLGAYPVYSELFSPGEAVYAHLEPGQTAHAMLVAPASANMLAKLAHGLADDIVSAQALAFKGPLLVAPAMNPRMLENAAVRSNIACLRDRGCTIIGSGSGTLACGDVGSGKLAALPVLFWETLKALCEQDMAGSKVLITLGATREYWDGVRFWSNPSTGRMGASLALAAWLRGARVYAVAGPSVRFSLPAPITRIDVTSACEMYEACCDLWPEMKYGIFTAAVSDFAPKRRETMLKCKKTDFADEFSLPFGKNPDILAHLAQEKRDGQKILGFAAETTDDMQGLLVQARAKRERKQADVLAANRVNSRQSGFATAMNSMAVVDARGREAVWDTQSKSDIAWRLCTWLLDL